MKRKKEKSIGTCYGWLIGYNYRYKWIMTADE
jgi:hypothetical protein